MTCKKYRTLMYDLLDGALSASDLERVRRHAHGCEKCRRLVQAEEALAILVRDSAAPQELRYRRGVPSLTETEALNPAHKGTGLPPWILSAGRRPPYGRTFRLGFTIRGLTAGAVLVLLGLSGFFLFRPQGHEPIRGASVSAPGTQPDSAPRVQVISVELKGKPARPYIYQTPKASFIWVAPSKDIGG